MKVLIFGAGVIGVTTAYYLSEKGHDVTVVDSASGPGIGTSYANGAQLSYSKTHPLSDFSTLKKLPGMLFSKNPAIRIHPGLDLDFLKWGVSFLRECFRAEQNAAAVLDIALRSREEMHKIVQREEINFDYARRGKMYVFSDRKDFAEGIADAEELQKHGFEQKVLTPGEAVGIEPALEDMQKSIYGAIYSPMDESGDCRKFCEEMARVCVAKGVKFRYGESLEKVHTDKQKITAVITNKGELQADKIVLCLGTQSARICKMLGLNVKIYPMKGYSITVPATDKAPNINITDEARRIVYSKIGDRLRVAGVAEFAGHNMLINRKVIDGIVAAAEESFPKAADYSVPQEWAGLRPMTPSTVPVIGKSGKFSNLYLNTGHGMLGWTLACGSAAKLADVIGN